MKSNKSKPQHAETVTIGEVLLCKMKGYCEWPCVVTAFDRGFVAVEFFGDSSTHRAAIHNFYKFADCSDMILTHLKGRKNPLYSKSVKEAEDVVGIPVELSILNRITA